MKSYSLLCALLCTVQVFGMYSLDTYKDILKNTVYPQAKKQVNLWQASPYFTYGQIGLGFLGASFGINKIGENILQYRKLSPQSYDTVDPFIGKQFRLNYINMEKELMLHRASRYGAFSCFAAWNLFEGLKKSRLISE